MSRAIFTDRDGVLNRDPGYVHKIGDFKLLPGVIEALKLLKDFKLIIITNQSGIGRGYYTKEDFLLFNNYLTDKLKKQGIKIEKTYYCPHHPAKNCDCRKPKTKFIEEAKKEFNIDLSKSFVIGDHPHDIEMGRKVGCRSVYLLTGHGQKHKDNTNIKADFIANDLCDAAKWILNVKERI